MVLWTVEKENTLGQLNEASLLQRFVEANLNRSNPTDLDRGAMDFLINDKFLSHLAHEMVQQGSDYIGKNELLDFTIQFIKSRS